MNLFGGMSFGQLAIKAVIVAAIVAIVYVALWQFGIIIPAWVVNIGWILAVAFVVIAAIQLLMGMGKNDSGP